MLYSSLVLLSPFKQQLGIQIHIKIQLHAVLLMQLMLKQLSRIYLVKAETYTSPSKAGQSQLTSNIRWILIPETFKSKKRKS